ncbi:MAG: glucosidase [Methylotenera sp.]|nr:glucosidase [Methylotenera sp.]
MKHHKTTINAEQVRLKQQANHEVNWYLWGPYLSERAWGTVREDYSEAGTAWEYFDHDQSRTRAYRWNEDGLGGISDEQQRLCFSIALWNGEDPILKERAFGLTGNQGNHGEDVKEYYFYQGALPSHAWLQYLYKYPQREFPYQTLIDENKQRGRDASTYSLLDTGVFAENRYWDVEVKYAKAEFDRLHISVEVTNRGDAPASAWVLPQLWFRNTWSWSEHAIEKPNLSATPAPEGAKWAVMAAHAELGLYALYGMQDADPLYTENETNQQQLWGVANESPYVKDAFHRYLIHHEHKAINPQQQGTKFAAAHKLMVAAGKTERIDLVLTSVKSIETPNKKPFLQHKKIMAQRASEFEAFYQSLLPDATLEDSRIMRQAFSGLIWNKQFYHYDVETWLKGDISAPPASHKHGRNAHWQHLKASDVISMPDKWEYPWFAAWDLAFHCAAFAPVDVHFAKSQIELLVSERYMHPNGQIPAYEWAFGDTNPPVHAMGALKVYRAERIQAGKGDVTFLKRVLHKLLLNYAWWINRKDAEGQNVFGGGFLGLDNISVYDRSRPLPEGYMLKQADATGWMAMFALNLTAMALEITNEDDSYQDIAIQCYSQFLAIAKTMTGMSALSVSLWDDKDGFFKDLVTMPDGSMQRIDVFSWVGIIPLFACEVIDPSMLKNAPRFVAVMNKNRGGMLDGHTYCACPTHTNERGEHMLALVDVYMLTRVLSRIFDEEQFLSRYGIRSVSKLHAMRSDLGHIPGIGQAVIEYVPGESTNGLFGGNSNWRGPVWMPTNYMLIQVLEKYARYLGDGYTFPAPCLGGQSINLKQASKLLADRVVDTVRRNEHGYVPAFPERHPKQHDTHWQDLLTLHEYYHAESGQGLGAQHQTGWTALIANLIFRRYRDEVPAYWRK